MTINLKYIYQNLHRPIPKACYKYNSSNITNKNKVVKMKKNIYIYET